MLPVLLSIFSACPLPPPAPPSGTRTVAITIDDLPYVQPEGSAYLPGAKRVTDQILRVLKVHRAPAIGFVNEAQLLARGEVDERIALLQRWVDAGMALGNHTYSHADFNKLTIAEFADEIVRGEVVTQRLLQRRPRYFRFPQTHTGDTKEKKEALEAFLRERGYQAAPFTFETADYVFNPGYVRAVKNKDRAQAEKLRRAYLTHVMAAADFAVRTAQQIFGRDVPQTILFHANDISADSLDEMLACFEARGFRFITFEAALADPAYGTPDTLVTPYGPSWLWRWNKSSGKQVGFAGDPEPPAWVAQ